MTRAGTAHRIGTQARAAVPPDDLAPDPVLIDCDSCVVRGDGCPDCVVTALLGLPGPVVAMVPTQLTALHVLADSGLVPPLRHTRPGSVHRASRHTAAGPDTDLR